MQRVALRDVTLRDGLQDERPVSTDHKIALFEALVSAGVTDLELTSFVRPDRVPAMADADLLSERTSRSTDIRRWGLVLNEKGAVRALQAGLSHLQYVISVSETHQRHNTGLSVDASVKSLERIVQLAKTDSRTNVVELTLATAFGCPFEGAIASQAVLELVDRAARAGVGGICLADTIGTAVPNEVSHLVTAVKAKGLGIPVGVHFHDTRGLGIANALAAIDRGVDRLDGTVGGLGGCPFAPGASGNLPLEDLAHALEQMDYDTGLDVPGLIAAGHLACDLVGRKVSSHIGVAGPRFASLAPPPP